MTGRGTVYRHYSAHTQDSGIDALPLNACASQRLRDSSLGQCSARVTATNTLLDAHRRRPAPISTACPSERRRPKGPAEGLLIRCRPIAIGRVDAGPPNVKAKPPAPGDAGGATFAGRRGRAKGVTPASEGVGRLQRSVRRPGTMVAIAGQSEARIGVFLLPGCGPLRVDGDRCHCSTVWGRLALGL